MLEFFWPAAFILLPLPYILRNLFKQDDSSQNSALIIGDIDDFNALKTSAKDKMASRFNLISLIGTICWISLVIAVARPVWTKEPVMISENGRDLMLAVDLSGSMMTKDFEVNGKVIDRLSATKLILAEFIEKRKGDRLGLILFGSSAYLQAPLTFDSVTIRKLLMESAVGLAGNETAIGDAIGISLKHLKDLPDKSKVLILLTDGNNNAGELTLDQAADLAAKANLKIYTIAIGSSRAKRGLNFPGTMPPMSSSIDEKSLENIAEKTKGKAFRAYDTDDLRKIYQHLDQLEPIVKDGKFYRPIEEAYFIPMGFALLLLSGLIFRKVKR